MEANQVIQNIDRKWHSLLTACWTFSPGPSYAKDGCADVYFLCSISILTYIHHFCICRKSLLESLIKYESMRKCRGLTACRGTSWKWENNKTTSDNMKITTSKLFWQMMILNLDTETWLVVFLSYSDVVSVWTQTINKEKKKEKKKSMKNYMCYVSYRMIHWYTQCCGTMLF